MKNDQSAKRPRKKLCPIVCRTSDLDYDFGAPVLPDRRSLHGRWHIREVEEERGLRADVYRSLGLL